MALDSQPVSILSHIVFIAILQRFLIEHLVSVQSLLLFSLGAFLSTFNSDSWTNYLFDI